MSAWFCHLTNGKTAQKIVPPRLRIPWWKGLGADSVEKHEPVSDIDIALVDSLKVLDPKLADLRRGHQRIGGWVLRLRAFATYCTAKKMKSPPCRVRCYDL